MGKDNRQSENAVLARVSAWETEKQEQNALKKQRMMEAGCIQGGCSGHQEEVDELCKRCGFWQEEDKRRRALPLTVGSDGMRHRDISGREPRRKRIYEGATGWQYRVIEMPEEGGWRVMVLRHDDPCWRPYGKKLILYETQDQAQKALDRFAKKFKWDEII